jgi:arylsulfatase A-like enzyme
MPATRDNVVLVHWHDVGRHLHSYGVDGVVSPRTDELAAESFLFTDAHATAPLCSPSRGSLLTGRYPHDNGLVGLAHHGWAYRDDVETLPTVLSRRGWRTALLGMQHESADPATLGYDEHDASTSFCDEVVAKAESFLDRVGDTPFLLNAGFFETHRPYPKTDYEHADPATVTVPSYLPDTPPVREDLAGFYGSIVKADVAVGRLLDALDRRGLAENTWVVFHTDHGEAFPRAKSTLYAAGTGIAFMIRPPRRRGLAARTVDDLLSGVDLVPTLLDLLAVDIPEKVQGVSHAARLSDPTAPPARAAVFTEKTYHDCYDPIRAVRTKAFSYLESYTVQPEVVLPLDIADSLSGVAVADSYRAPRPPVELYDLRADPGERANLAGRPEHAVVQAELAKLLHRWREDTLDELPSEAEGTAIAQRSVADYLARQQA